MRRQRGGHPRSGWRTQIRQGEIDGPHRRARSRWRSPWRFSGPQSQSISRPSSVDARASGFSHLCHTSASVTDRGSPTPFFKVCEAASTRSRNSIRKFESCRPEDAVSCEQVSAPNSLLEINREFCRIRPSTAILVADRSADSIAYSQIPYATEQGILKCISGNFFRGTGKFDQATPRLSSADLAVDFAALKPTPLAKSTMPLG